MTPNQAIKWFKWARIRHPVQAYDFAIKALEKQAGQDVERIHTEHIIVYLCPRCRKAIDVESDYYCPICGQKLRTKKIHQQ